MNFVKRVFITGFVVLVPFVLTIYVLIALFQFADAFLGRYINDFLKEYYSVSFPGLGIVLALIIIFFLGFLGVFFRGRLLRFIENLIHKVPLMNQIYPAIKLIVDFLVSKDHPAFKLVVVVEYPRKGIYSLGFVTNDGPASVADKLGKKVYNVFIPLTPSPMTGMFLVVPEEEVVFLDITVEEALKLIVSGGVLNPKSLKKTDDLK